MRHAKGALNIALVVVGMHVYLPQLDAHTVSAGIEAGTRSVGATNPYALVEALIGGEVSRKSERVTSDVLQTDYDELFDMKFNSALYAGVQQ